MPLPLELDKYLKRPDTESTLDTEAFRLFVMIWDVVRPSPLGMLQ